MPVSEAALAALADHISAALGQGFLRAPLTGEYEPAFTRGPLQSLLQTKLRELSIPGLVRSGDGAARVRTVQCLGLPFFPDLAISYFQEPLIAVEVKYLRSANRQNSVATATGQALIYRTLGYRSTFVCLIDLANLVDDANVIRSHGEVFRPSGLELVVRRKVGGALIPDPGPGEAVLPR